MFGAFNARRKQSILRYTIGSIESGKDSTDYIIIFLAMNIEEPYPLRWNGWYHCAAIIIWGLVAIVLLLFGITLYSFIRSKTHPDLRFKDVFGRVFR